MYYGVFAALVVTSSDRSLSRPGRVQHDRRADNRATKAMLVILFFMHVRWSSRLTWVVAMSGFFWLLILFSLGMSDYMSRGWIPGTLR